MRSATLQIGSKRYGMDDLYFEFEVPFEDSDTLQTAKFKAYVIAWLKEHGVKVDETELDALIEAAVYELNQGIIPIEGVTIETTTEVEREEQTDHE